MKMTSLPLAPVEAASLVALLHRRHHNLQDCLVQVKNGLKTSFSVLELDFITVPMLTLIKDHIREGLNSNTSRHSHVIPFHSIKLMISDDHRLNIRQCTTQWQPVWRISDMLYGRG
jgi:hypothetical protein